MIDLGVLRPGGAGGTHPSRGRGRGVRRVEVTANQHALTFYENAGFVVDHEVATRFGPAPRMHMDIAPADGGT